MASAIRETEDIRLDDDLYGNVVIEAVPLRRTDLSPKSTRNLLIEVNPTAADITHRYRLPNAIIELRPVDNVDSWHGKKGIQNFDRHKIIECFVDKGIYATGLTEDEKTYLEAITGYTLNNHFNPYNEHPFYEKAIGRVRLENKTILLNLSDPLSYIKYKLILNHPLVANSLSDYENGLNPQASHYIIDAEEEELREVEKASKFQEADKLWELYKSPGMRRAILTIMMQTDCSYMSPDLVEARLTNLKAMDVSKFISVAKLPKDIITNKALIISCVSKVVIVYKDGTYFYNDSILGSDLDTASAFLSNPQNQQLKLRILDHFKSKIV